MSLEENKKLQFRMRSSLFEKSAKQLNEEKTKLQFGMRSSLFEKSAKQLNEEKKKLQFGTRSSLFEKSALLWSSEIGRGVGVIFLVVFSCEGRALYGDLSTWNQEAFGNIQLGIKKHLNLLKQTSDARARKLIFNTINDLRRKEEVLWWQRSRTDFLKFGDCNSRWFHNKANRRKSTIHIAELKDVDG
ncbi:hypothetical protein Cgig2_003422 [Carnegiea gigantea]|uniref:Uncharacterized protein n=1 Tax=Carnegiea gigantea TaxID=171969 RepID=A0A9Q1KA60_9CARY|nr:hypothetical protein Cgig2_003422 [Carnegiea gigantea]